MDILAVIIFFIAIILIVIKIYPSLKKWEEERQPTPTSEPTAPPTPAPPAKKFPVGTVIGVIAVIVVGTLIFYAVIPFVSNLGNYNNKVAFTETIGSYQVTQNPDGSVIFTADAKVETEVEISYTEGQTITFTASGIITGSTNPRDGANRNVGPEGWSCEPIFLQGRQKMLQSAPFMGLLGKFENGEWFYIGKGITKTPKTSGQKISFIFNDANEPVFADNGGYCTVTIKKS